MRRRTLFSFALALSTAACSGGDAPDEGDGPIIVSGAAAIFGEAQSKRIEGATVTVLERPELSATTAADGSFSFEGIEAGEEVTIILQHPEYPLTQLGTHVVPSGGITDLSFQVPAKDTYDLLAAVVGITPDPTRCQLVTTITRAGGTIFAPGAHGEAGVTVTSEPALPPESSIIYFNASVIPDKTLTESSEDGGVLSTNVPPGEYVWSGHKQGVSLSDVKFKCRAGVLINASPPRGMNVL